MDSLMTPGSQLTRLMVSAGFPNKLGNVIGAALDSKVGNNAAVARHILDAFSPFSRMTMDRLIDTGMVPLGFCKRPYENYLCHFANAGITFNPDQFERLRASMLARCMNPQDVSNVIQNLATSLQNSGENTSALLVPNGSFDAQIAQLLQGMMGPLQQAIQQKLNEMMPAAAPVMGKKRKKKGGLKGKLKKGMKGLKKVGKGFKKIGKMAKGITKMGKGSFKGVLKGVKGLFKGNLLKGLFQLGGGLLGGLVGGPLGSSMIGQIASAGLSKLLGKKKGAKLQQVFGQMSKMFQVVGNIQNGSSQFNIQGLAKMIRA